MPSRHLDQAAAPQRDHAALDRLLLQFHRRRADQNQFPDLVVDFHHFVQTAAPLVAGVVADAAALALLNLDRLGLFRRVAFFNQRLSRHVDHFGAVLANAADQSLRADQVDRGRHQEWLDTHVHQARDRFRRTVGVQRGKHQVARERGLDGDFRRFEVSNFADQNDVRVLPQEGAQRGGKVQADLLLHLHLVDALQLELDRIFGRHDVGIGLVQPRDGGIQSVGLARSRRPGDQHHSVGLQNRFLELDQRLGLETELGHVEAQVLFVEQPHARSFRPTTWAAC